MKTFLLLLVAAVIVGAIYHTEVTRYVADLNIGSSSSGGSYSSSSGPSVVSSMRAMGNSGSALMGGVGNAIKP